MPFMTAQTRVNLRRSIYITQAYDAVNSAVTAGGEPSVKKLPDLYADLANACDRFECLPLADAIMGLHRAVFAFADACKNPAAATNAATLVFLDSDTAATLIAVMDA